MVSNTSTSDVSSLDFWAQPALRRDETFARLRREEPVSYQEPLTFGLAGMMGDVASGYWLVTTHELVRTASREPDVFCSGQGILLEDLTFPPELREQIGSFLATDGQRHSTLRRLVSKAFNPRNVARIEAQIAQQARRTVDHLLEVGDCDFVAEVATRLPLWTISEMVGVPEGEREGMMQAANTMVATSDPEFVAQGDSAFMAFIAAAQQIWEMAGVLAQARRAHPEDDLMTALVEAEVDGQRLTDEEIGAFMTLLAVAGNDTTRNTISHTMKALGDHPDQWRRLASDPDAHLGLAVEEFVRWATPVIYFRRYATRDTVLGGVAIAEGENIVLLYESANRDESVFKDPWHFDIARDPNDHLGFGGGGPHFCMGAHLARTQLRCVFTELATRVPRISIGEPEYLASNFIHGVKRMPCRL